MKPMKHESRGKVRAKWPWLLGLAALLITAMLVLVMFKSAQSGRSKGLNPLARLLFGLNEGTRFAPGYTDKAFYSIKLGDDEATVTKLLGDPLLTWTNDTQVLGLTHVGQALGGNPPQMFPNGPRTHWAYASGPMPAFSSRGRLEDEVDYTIFAFDESDRVEEVFGQVASAKQVGVLSAGATVNRVLIAPGDCFFRRTYMVIGTLQEVAEAGRKLESFTDLHPVEFKESDTPLLPLYIKRADKAPPQPTLEKPAPDAQAVCQLYSKPVRHSKPIFLLQDGGTGEYILTTDPALQCRKLPFANPYPAGHEKHAKLQNRHQYLTHQTRTKSWQLLGYAMPADKADTNIQHRKLIDVPDLGPLFQAGECTKADALLVR